MIESHGFKESLAEKLPTTFVDVAKLEFADEFGPETRETVSKHFVMGRDKFWNRWDSDFRRWGLDTDEYKVLTLKVVKYQTHFDGQHEFGMRIGLLYKGEPKIMVASGILTEKQMIVGFAREDWNPLRDWMTTEQVIELCR